MPSSLRASVRVLGPLRPDSIRNRILLFALIAALLPSVTTAWLAYRQNQRSIAERTDQDLRAASDQAWRELELWLRDRLHELRTFTGSYEVRENVGRAAGTPTSAGRITEYLESVVRSIPEYGRLFVTDPNGRLVANSGSGRASPDMPADWITTLRTAEQVVGEPAWDSLTREPRLTLAVPIRSGGTGQLIGVLGAEMRFRQVRSLLRSKTPGDQGRAYLITYDRRIVVASDSASAELMETTLSPAVAGLLFENQTRTVTYTGLGGEPVLGTLRRVPTLDWAVVAEIPTRVAYQQVRDVRNGALLILVALVLGIGLIAYRLGLLIVRPLDLLTRATGEVAKGDFTVDLPPAGGGEVGYLTQVFNDMVARLREKDAQVENAQETLRRQNVELERLSVTDGLTGLINRRRLMEVLVGEIERSKRMSHVCTVLMMDVDHFKRYNDAQGHQAGDDVLRGVGAVLREATREMDWSARYGGEEFFALLPETDAKEAGEVAERIRTKLRERIFVGGRVTLSIGMAQFPTHGESPETVIAAADAALYQAKADGRDRVVRAGGTKRGSGSQRGA